MNATIEKLLAVAALAGICACSGPANGTGNAIPSSPSFRHNVAARGRGILTTIVGVGDSLTAGYQAGGFLGATNVKNPLVPGTPVRPGQENGFWADLDEMASGLPEATAIAQMYDPATSPLPLIKGPGLNNQLVPAQPPTPFGLLKPGNACTDNRGFNAEGYLLSGLSIVRMNPGSKSIRDVAVPGMTLHEANVLYEPQTNTCNNIPGVPGLLNLIVAGESSTYWPVLGNYANLNTNLSMVRAAASRHPTLATVWLGANDVLKFMGSGGRFVGGDNSPAQVSQDLVTTIQTLQYSGAHTVVANLPNVLLTPYFLRVTIPGNRAICKVQTFAYCTLTGLAFPPSTAKQLINQIAASYHLSTTACKPGTTTSPCGYLTLQGALGALSYYLTYTKLPDLDCSGVNFTAPCVAGSGIGTYYITPALAGKIQVLNDNVNTGIANAATYTQSAFVDVRAIFDGITSGNPADPYFQRAVSIHPGTCCTLAAGGGLVSFDGLHPSNTGYALVAYYFIQAINRRYATHIPEIDVKKAYNGTRCSNKLYCFPDAYAPQVIQRQWLTRSGNRLEFNYSSNQ